MHTNSSEKAPLCCSQRFSLWFLAFLGKALTYAVRVNLSVAILCMTRDDIKMDNSTVFNNMTSYNVTEAPGEAECGNLATTDTKSSGSERGEFDWDKATQSRLLAMYFYGYIFTQIPGGWLASKYGGRRVWRWCMFVCAVCTLVTPVAARTNVYVALVARFTLGFAAGVTFPCVHALLGRWVPPFERSKSVSVTFAGPLVGNIATFAISGFLCEYGFDNGWASIFYISGIFNMLWVLVWFWCTADTPAKHKRISERERMYIESSIGRSSVAKVTSVPWLSMFKSVPLWAAIIGHLCNNWVNYTLLTSLPTFMKESLKFDIKQNGALSAAPYVMQLVCSIVGSFIADTLRERGILSTTTVRKSWQAVSFWGTAVCIILAGQMTCETRTWAVVMLCLCTGFMGLNRSGYTVNHLDLAPQYAGILFGITNTAATIPGMIAPIVNGALTPNRTPEEWRVVFYVCGAVAAAGGFLYLLMADGELQDWALPAELKGNTLTVELNTKKHGDGAKEELTVEDDTHKHNFS